MKRERSVRVTLPFTPRSAQRQDHPSERPHGSVANTGCISGMDAGRPMTGCGQRTWIGEFVWCAGWVWLMMGAWRGVCWCGLVPGW